MMFSLGAVQRETIVDPHEKVMKRIYFGFNMFGGNGTVIMRSVNFSSTASRDRAMRTMARKLGMKIK